MRTRAMSSIARARAARRSSGRCDRTASLTWAPTRMVGLRERAGSWKTIARSAPRRRRSSFSASPISSVPANRAEPVTTADGGSRPITARQLTVLPDPDSPTIASVRPGQAAKLTPLTASTSWPRCRKLTRRSVTSSRPALIRLPPSRALRWLREAGPRRRDTTAAAFGPAPAASRVSVSRTANVSTNAPAPAQGVPEQVQRQHGGQQEQARDEHEDGLRRQGALAERDHVAPARRGGRDAEAEEAERSLQDDDDSRPEQGE